jgi:uncharacterized protein involved in type VI secretion and phage assembly
MDEDITQHLLQWVRGHYFGKFRGTVTDNQDATNRARLKVMVPAVLGSLEVWAMPCVPYAGQGVGFYSLPESGAAVWVEFEGGDPSFPVWTGCFWGDDELYDDNTGTQVSPPVKILRSAKGLIVSLSDDDQAISLSDDQGNNLVTLRVTEGLVKVLAGSKVVIEAPAIELVENATHPLVFGDQLLQYLSQLVTMFNSHTHPGEMALGVFPVTPMIPVPPWTPPDPSLLSTIVKNG